MFPPLCGTVVSQHPRLHLICMCLVDQVEAGGNGSRLISELRLHEIVAVTEVPEDTDCGWLGGFRVRHPEQSGWFPAHVVSRAPSANALKGKLAKMLPEGVGAAALLLREEEKLLEELDGQQPDEVAHGGGAGGRENGSTPQVAVRAGSAAGWTVAATPRTPPASANRSLAEMARRASRDIARTSKDDGPPLTPTWPQARP